MYACVWDTFSCYTNTILYCCYLCICIYIYVNIHIDTPSVRVIPICTTLRIHTYNPFIHLYIYMYILVYILAHFGSSYFGVYIYIYIYIYVSVLYRSQLGSSYFVSSLRSHLPVFVPPLSGCLHIIWSIDETAFAEDYCSHRCVALLHHYF